MSNKVFSVPIDFMSHDGKTTINAKLWTSSEFGDGSDCAAGASADAIAGEAAGKNKPKGIIQIVHGMSEYIDRYDDFAKYLVEQGFVVCGMDNIGHGKSVLDASEHGHIPLHGGKEILLNDIHALRRIASGLFSDIPYIIYGHSMGSFAVRAYIARHGDGLAACVLSGTGNVPAPLSKFGRALAQSIAAVRGERYRSPLIDSMGAGGYGKQIPNARTPLDWLSTDRAVVDAYIADEQCGFMFTVGGYATLLDLTGEVVSKKCAEKVPSDLPILLVAGNGDPVGNKGKGVVAAAQLLRDAGVKTVDCKIFSGMRHEVHNEIGRERVYSTISEWISRNI